MAWRPIAGSPPQIDASDGTSASGYFLKFYASGTTTPINMATDSTGGTTLAKCQINASGYPINGSSAVFIPYIDQKYRLVLYTNATDADANTFGNADWDLDAIDYAADIRDELANTSNAAQGDALVGVLRTDTGAVAQTVHSYIENMEFNVKSFGATGDGVTDDSAAIQACFDATPAEGMAVYFPAGTYRVETAIAVPENRNGGRVYGDGDASIINAIGVTAFTFDGEGWYRFCMEHLHIKGDNTAGQIAIDTSPTTASDVFAGATFKNLRISQVIHAWKLKNAQINSFQDCNVDFTTATCDVFYILPDSGSAQQCNANRVLRMRVTGDGTMLNTTLPTATERATNWTFRDCDIQFNGSQIPFYIIDKQYIIDGCEFENSTATYLIHIESTGTTLAPSYHYISNNLMTGGASGTKVKLTKTGTQIPSRCTFINNDGGNGTWLDDGGAYTTVIGCNGTVTDSASTSYFRQEQKNGILYLNNENTGANKGGIVVDGIGGPGKAPAENVGGTTTLSSGTAAVAFDADRQEADANYYIYLSGDTSGETFTWASKATSGFTINSDNGASTANVDWLIVR